MFAYQPIDSICEETASFVPNRFHRAIFAAIETTNNPILIDAVAGSGKTSTLLECAALIRRKRPFARMIFVAFNRTIVRELSQRIPHGAIAKTFNSLGASALTSRFGGDLILEPKKINVIINFLLRANPDVADTITAYYSDTVRLVDLARQTWASLPVELQALADYHDLLFSGSAADCNISRFNPNSCGNAKTELYRCIKREQFDFTENCDVSSPISFTKSVLYWCNRFTQDAQIVDYTDQLYAPIAFGWRNPHKGFDVVFVDEAQDLNEIQFKIIKELLRPETGRVIASGDPRQSIYGFRGAHNNAVDRFVDVFPGTLRVPLSVCYRCAKQIVRQAQTIEPVIEFDPKAKEGMVTVYPCGYQADWFSPGDAVLCRNSAPLMRLAAYLLEHDRDAVLLDTDIEQRLTQLMKRCPTEDALNEYRLQETARLISLHKYDRLESTDDYVETALSLVERGLWTPTAIHLLFHTTAENPIVLSTCHKAKGMEWDTVFALDTFLIPSRYATQNWQLKQEHNLAYVLYTRARTRLIFITSPAKGK